MNNPLSKFREIKTFVFDVDGVLTDNNLFITEDGQLLRTMNARDGFAMKLAMEAGFKVAIITGGRSKGVIERLKGLGIVDIFAGTLEKKDAFEELSLTYNLNPEEVLYMGDDLPDIQVLREVGLPCCPKNAAPEVVNESNYISPYNGGAGCVRDVIEKVMRVQDKWPLFENGQSTDFKL